MANSLCNHPTPCFPLVHAGRFFFSTLIFLWVELESCTAGVRTENKNIVTTIRLSNAETLRGKNKDREKNSKSYITNKDAHHAFYMISSCSSLSVTPHCVSVISPPSSCCSPLRPPSPPPTVSSLPCIFYPSRLPH